MAICKVKTLADWKFYSGIWLGKYLFMLILLQLAGASNHIRHVQYNVSEGVPEGYTIGDLLSDSNLRAEFHSDIIKSLFFKPLSKVPANISLAQDSGMIVVTGEIDREKICLSSFVCELNVDIAVQPSEYFRIIKVKLHVHDINDNSPMFTVETFVTTLSETSDRETVIQLPYAEDKDSLQFGVQRYQILPQVSMFRLKIQNNVDGSRDVALILNGVLDFERRKSYNLSLIAEDGGTPAKSGSIQIAILITDANDHIPEFENSTYEITVSENIAIGSTLLTVRAHDRDSGLNAAISYSFSDRTYALYSNYLAVNNITGDIVVRDTIDYEINHVFQLSVVARDLGQNSHAVDSTVIVRVLDENDCSPEIDINTLNSMGSTGLSEIREESPVGSFVAHLSVTDRDTGPRGRVQCQITNPNFSLSNLSAKEYQIETAATMDREVRDTYIIMIKCNDNGTPSNHIQRRLLVRVQDINDHAPVFTQKVYDASVTENYYGGQEEILRINASDGDINENGHISYEIVDKQYKSYFAIGKSSGVLTSLQRFDREKQSTFRFFVSATDNALVPKSSLAKVIIHILDVNDEAPVFSQSSYHFSLLENEQVGTYVGSVSAVDRDTHANSQFSFRLLQNNGGSFLVNPHNGDLSTTQKLDREKTDKYHLIVEARDKGIPSKSSTADITIEVLDQNDNIPKFVFPTYDNDTVQIPAAVPKGYVITRIVCVDPDYGDNGLLQYHVVASNGQNLFKMNNTSGFLYMSVSHRFIDGQMFTLDIAATERANSAHLAKSTLYITVNSSLPVGPDNHNTGILTGYNLKTVIIVAVIFGIVITSLIIIVILVYCQRNHRPRNMKQRTRYDKFHARPRTVDQAGVKDSSQMAVLHSSLHDYAKDTRLLGEYEYLRRPSSEPLGPNLNYLLNKKEGCHQNDYQKVLCF